MAQIDTARAQLTQLRDGVVSRRLLSDDTKARLTKVINGLSRVKAQVATEVPKAIAEIKGRIFQALDQYAPTPKTGTTQAKPASNTHTIKAKQTDAPDGPAVPKPTPPNETVLDAGSRGGWSKPSMATYARTINTKWVITLTIPMN